MSQWPKHSPLLPCPVCGGEDAYMWEVGCGEDTTYYVECLDCGTQTKLYQGPELAAQAWNGGKSHTRGEDLERKPR